MKTSNRIILLVAIALLSLGARAQTKEPLTIKGVALGDSTEKATQIGLCNLTVRAMCMGKTTFGQDSTADFFMNFVGGKVNSITVQSQPRYSREMLAGLTSKYGEPKPTGNCKAGVVCHSWTSDGVTMLLIDELGAVTLTRAAPAGGY